MPSGNHNQPRNANPYSSAAGAYSTNAQKNANDPREVEARVLLKSAQFMADLQNVWDDRPKESLEDVLKYNRNIWLMFYDTAIDSTNDERPETLRNNIYNLAQFVFKREADILIRPEKQKLDILIKINRDIAGGLLNGVRNAAASTDNTAAQTDGGAADVKKPPTGGWDTSA